MDGVFYGEVGIIDIGFNKCDDVGSDSAHFCRDGIKFPAIVVNLYAVNVLYIYAENMVRFLFVEDVSNVLVI